MNVEEMTVIKETSIDVPTIKCGSCVKTVSSVLKKLDGVKEVNVDKKTKKASVKYDSEKVKIADMESAISKAGYDANEMKKDEKAYEELDDCCK
jgi:copper chaperone CopZ